MMFSSDYADPVEQLEDFEKIGQAWMTVCAEVLKELGIKPKL